MLIGTCLLLLSSIVALELFWLMRLSDDAMSIVVVSKESVEIMRSTSVHDDHKPALMTTQSARLLAHTLRFTLKLLLIVGLVLGVGVVVVAEYPEVGSEIWRCLSSPMLGLALVIAVSCYAWGRGALRKRMDRSL